MGRWGPYWAILGDHTGPYWEAILAILGRTGRTYWEDILGHTGSPGRPYWAVLGGHTGPYWEAVLGHTGRPRWCAAVAQRRPLQDDHKLDVAELEAKYGTSSTKVRGTRDPTTT